MVKNVVIVGSGMAAITAARELSRNGIKVTILEAMDRLGGRIHTVKRGERKYDLGASWMHDTLVNPLFLTCAKEGITMEYDDESHGYFTKYGPIPRELNITAVAEDLDGMMELDYGLGKYRQPDQTLKTYAIEFVNKWPLISERNKKLVPRLAQFHELWTGVPWNEAGAATTLLDFMGRNAFMIEGMSSIYEFVRKDVNWDHTDAITNAVVQKISTDGETYLVSTDQRTYEADYVICTIPLGGLKNFHAQLFDLPLSESLSKAMREGVMGALGKVVLEFDTCWWHNEFDQIKFIVDEDPEIDLGLGPGNQPLDFINAFRKHPAHNQHALIVLTAPPLTQFVEANPDKAFSYLLPALRAIRKNQNEEVPEPVFTMCTDWTLNPWIGGSYTGVKVGHTFDETVQPFIEGADRLRFAGEHTVYDGNGCVHGAYASGLREAGWILDHLQAPASGK
ncbi:Corticosteroid-binding protein [Wickerhamiella sorbophila]|uniref:Corticosteroid-binding protein n=1 Tax=Wickerhamiella sorbophila TaxID=45607 RepID=A0A2T0FPP0_9ASCO|nr:Corticosteroid-binding protein [Wickerhamiella sorbophila]PRT56948.1 Corticosteroid-binding protein [Wickerhamiella sorbophila]